MQVTICLTLQQIKHLVAKFGQSYNGQPITIQCCEGNNSRETPLYLVSFEIRDSMDVLYVFQSGGDAIHEKFSKLK